MPCMLCVPCEAWHGSCQWQQVKPISEQQTCCMSCLGVSRRGCGALAGAGDALGVSAAAGSAAVTKSESGVALELTGDVRSWGEPNGPMAALPDAAAAGDTATVGAGAGVLVGSR